MRSPVIARYIAVMGLGVFCGANLPKSASENKDSAQSRTREDDLNPEARPRDIALLAGQFENAAKVVRDAATNSSEFTKNPIDISELLPELSTDEKNVIVQANGYQYSLEQLRKNLIAANDAYHKALAELRARPVDGPFELRYANGQFKLRGTYKNGQRDGLWESFNENGELDSKGIYENGLKTGPWTSLQYGGLVCVAEYLAGKLHGSYFVRNQDGQLLERGSYTHGNRQGLWESWHANATLESKQQFDGGLLIDGTYESFFDNGNLRSRTTYRSGQPHGISESWYINGQRESVSTLENGQRNGELREWYENGNLQRTATFEHGKEAGTTKTYYENGFLEAEYNYLNGLKQGALKRFSEKKESLLIFQGLFSADLQQGESLEYDDETGRLRSRSYWLNNQLDGRIEVYDPSSGRIITSGSYAEGKQDGEWNYYKSDGSLDRKEVWNVGVREK